MCAIIISNTYDTKSALFKVHYNKKGAHLWQKNSQHQIITQFIKSTTSNATQIQQNSCTIEQTNKETRRFFHHAILSTPPSNLSEVYHAHQSL